MNAAAPSHDWFRSHVPLRAIVEAVLERRLGRVTLDDAADPRAARLHCGCYEILGGDPSAPGARDLVAAIPEGREIVYGNDADWRACVLATLPRERLRDRPMQSYHGDAIDRAQLHAVVSALALEFRLAPFDARTVAALDHELAPHALQAYADADAFLADGFGVAILRHDDVVAAATSYALSSSRVEIAIATRPAWRGRGLAHVAAAAFIDRALARGLAPHWNAANPISQRLAVRLGFRPADVCEALVLDPR